MVSGFMKLILERGLSNFMFTNLDFLNIGKPWTPDNPAYKRQRENYVTGRLLYEGNFESVFGEAWSKIGSRYGMNYAEIEQVMIKTNLFRTLTETFKTLAFQKEPEIWVGEGNEAYRLGDKNNTKEDDYPAMKALSILKRAFTSGHVQGDGVLKVYTNAEGEPDIAVVNAENWIPVYYPDNLDEVQCHVVANTYEVDNSSTILGVTMNNTVTYLNVEIHYRGEYEKRLYQLDNQKNIQKLLNSENIKTGFDGFTVFPFNYGTPAWRDYGVSAYTDLIPIVDEFVVRLSNNSKILDEHADPQPIVTENMLEFNPETGEKVYRRHRAMVYGKNGERPEYLTWDGNLSSSENQITRMLELFYMMSGTNPQLFGQDIAGNLSGEALAKILIIPIAKTKEMILSLEDACEKAFNCMLQLRKINKTVDIRFDIGQFNSESDITARVVQEKGAGITSTKRAVELINPRYTEKEVTDELELIAKDRESDSMTDIDNLFPKDDEEDENVNE